MTTPLQLVSDTTVPHLPFGRLHVQHLRCGEVRTVVVTGIDWGGSIIAERIGVVRPPDGSTPADIEAALRADVIGSLEARRN
jgi:hypothetical protein